MNDNAYQEDISEVFNRWSDGWAFYRGNGESRDFLPPVDDCFEWIKGYAAAQADYDLEPFREHGSIEDSLVDHRVTGVLLESCLMAAENVLEGDEWTRWPSVPVRSKDKMKYRN